MIAQVLSVNIWFSELYFCKKMYQFTQPLRYRQDMTQDQFISGEQLVWIQSFPFRRMIT